MRRVRHRLFREIFVPALRLFRDTLLTDPDVPRLRDWVAADSNQQRGECVVLVAGWQAHDAD